MSLYNALFGKEHGADALVQLLNRTQMIAVGRFRDAWVEKNGDGVLIRVHTRNGGGNRPDYESQIESMRTHPWYVRDADDDFDCTYADFWFEPPLPTLDRNLAGALLRLAQEPVNMGARWQAMSTTRLAPSSSVSCTARSWTSSGRRSSERRAAMMDDRLEEAKSILSLMPTGEDPSWRTDRALVNAIELLIEEVKELRVKHVDIAWDDNDAADDDDVAVYDLARRDDINNLDKLIGTGRYIDLNDAARRLVDNVKPLDGEEP